MKRLYWNCTSRLVFLPLEQTYTAHGTEEERLKVGRYCRHEAERGVCCVCVMTRSDRSRTTQNGPQQARALQDSRIPTLRLVLKSLRVTACAESPSKKRFKLGAPAMVSVCFDTSAGRFFHNTRFAGCRFHRLGRGRNHKSLRCFTCCSGRQRLPPLGCRSQPGSGFSMSLQSTAVSSQSQRRPKQHPGTLRARLRPSLRRRFAFSSVRMHELSSWQAGKGSQRPPLPQANLARLLLGTSLLVQLFRLHRIQDTPARRGD